MLADVPLDQAAVMEAQDDPGGAGPDQVNRLAERRRRQRSNREEDA
jgi:hypothetical protein